MLYDRVMVRAVILGLVLAVWSHADADSRPRRNPETVASATARGIVDGDTLVLDTGAEVRLVGIQAPKLPLGRRNFKAWPLAEEAKAALGALALGRRLRLDYDRTPIDRHGRLLAQLYDEDGRWIQGELLRRGMARVYTFADNRRDAAKLLAAEAVARAARRGIWGHPFYRVISEAESGRHIDTFQLVEGRVLNTAVVRGRGYLNFGRDWRTDFTVTISPRNMRLFRRARMPPDAFKGKRVRVRGWLNKRNGPMISASHPEQIEVLSE